ncbi:MAG: SCO family protein [Halobacteriovoraceae bacterium]|nr:SCO family protein [Halobacteriovoraceae bacterium]
MSIEITQGHLRDDSLLEKVVVSKTFWVLICTFFFGYPLIKSINRKLPDPLPVYYGVTDFNLSDEFGKPFGSKDLLGKVYIANFFFTSCTSTCPHLMKELQKIQKRLKGVGQSTAIVSFTVDPLTDTPEKLFKHSRKLNSNPWVWKFLTGNEETLRKTIEGGFKVVLGESKGKNDFQLYDIAHSEKLVLVDQKGRVRGLYSLDKNSINQLMLDVGLLVNNSFNRQI